MNLQSKALNGEILKLSVPSILANITIPLVGIVDTAIVGHLGDLSAIGGIAIGTMLFDLLYWNFGFLRVSTAGMTAQAYGRHDSTACTRLLTQSLTTALSAALLIYLVQWVFVTVVLWFTPCSAVVADFARRYFFIRVWAAPATLSLMALKWWFIGMQNTIAPMITDIVVNVVNMAASFFLAVYTPVGTLGVAWGTLIAQLTGLATAMVILVAKYRPTVRQMLDREFFRVSMQWQQIRRLMAMNGNLFVRSLCFMVVYVGYTTIAASYGDTELAVSTILMKLFMFFSYFVDGFAYAGEALSGRLGAMAEGGWHKNEQVRRVVQLLFVWATAVGLLFSVIYGLAGTLLISIMTDEPALLQASERYLLWLALMPITSALAFMWDGIFIGATADKAVRNCMIWAAVGFVLTYLCLLPTGSTHALYAAYFMHLFVRAVYLSIDWQYGSLRG